MWRAPSSPIAASASMKARAEKVDCAPQASARIASTPEVTPLSRITVMSRPTAAAIAGSMSTEAGAASNWRPPWLETITPSMPIARAFSASAGCSTPFTSIGPRHVSRSRASTSQAKPPPTWAPTKAAGSPPLA